MPTLYIIEFLLALIGIVLFIFQIFIPAISGTPLFPLIRKKKKTAVRALMNAREQAEILEIKRAALSLKQTLSKPTKEEPNDPSTNDSRPA